MKLLIAGAESPTGQELLQLLQRQGVGYGTIPDPMLRGDRSALDQFVGGQRANQLVNLHAFQPASQRALLAAETARGDCNEVQREHAASLAALSEKYGIPLIHLSTCYVFDGEKRLGYNEQDEVNPVGVFGKTALQGERAVQQLDKHIIIRTGWQFGRDQYDTIKGWIESCKRHGGQLQVLQRRFSPTPNEDVARTVLAVCRQVDCDASVWGTYHYCGLETKKEVEFVHQVLKYASQHDEQIYQFLDNFTISEVLPEKPEITNSTLSTKKIFDTFGIKQRSWHGSLKAAIKNMYLEPGSVGMDRVGSDGIESDGSDGIESGGIKSESAETDAGAEKSTARSGAVGSKGIH